MNLKILTEVVQSQNQESLQTPRMINNDKIKSNNILKLHHIRNSENQRKIEHV